MKKEMQLYKNKQDCCGCGACKSICPNDAISLEGDALGFFYPKIDTAKCVGCGLCIRVCAFKDKNSSLALPISSYAAASKNTEVLKRSTSGGIFAEVAKYIIKNGGIVFGCAYDDDWVAKHVEISTIGELSKLQGSKYVQSDVEDTFLKVQKYLNEGRWVLYSGTPCQISALRKFLKQNYANLYCIDIICHGVGSPQLLKEELKYLCKNQKIQAIDFRSKESGWGTTGVIYTDEKKIKFDTRHSAYYYYYLENTIYRDSCYNCRYSSEQRVGDLTVGDYWRIESAHPGIEKEIDLKKGISCILSNTKKGDELIKAIKDNLILIPSQYNRIRERNGQLVKCCSKPASRDRIFSIYQSEGYVAVVRDWKRRTMWKRIVLRVKNSIPSGMKTVLKRYL